MTHSGSDTGDDNQAPSPNRPRILTAEPRKFSENVLVPERERSKGKHRIFLDLFGFRPTDVDDARELTTTYVTRAETKFAAGEFEVGKLDHYGQRYTIEIELKGVVILSGWLWRADGVFWLTTPFAGFARRTMK